MARHEDLAATTGVKIYFAELDTRPRKTLGYLTPAARFKVEARSAAELPA
jgi:hypothetical protein